MDGESRDGWRRLSAAWAVIAILLAAFAAIQFGVNEAYRVRVDTAVAKTRQLEALDRQAVANAGRRLGILTSSKRVPLKEFERVLNQGQPLQRDRTRNLVPWVDPASGGEVEMTAIDDNSLLVATWPRTRRIIYPDPNLGIHGSMSLARRLVYIGAYVGWGLVLLFVLAGFRAMDRPQRLLWGNVLLMIAATSTSLSLLGYSYWRAWNHFFDDDAAGIGWLEIGISLLLLLLAFLYRRPETDPTPRCGACRYNLTGNISGRCPECGTPIPSFIAPAPPSLP